MNQTDKINKLGLEMVTELLSASTENYELMKISLLLSTHNDERIRDYINILIDFTDKHRPKAIERKEE